MAIFGNFKGTTQPDFKVGKTGARIHGNSAKPASADPGDIWIDSANTTINLYNGNTWNSIGATLAELNVDNGTLFVDNANDTVSIGSTSSNEKLFVNGSLRLGTNPAVKYSGAYLDFKHSNGTGTVVRIRDNNNGINPVFKVYTANNESEAFKVHGGNITINSAYTLPDADGSAGFAMVTDGDGNLSFAPIGDPVEDYGFISQAANVTLDYGGVTVDTRSPSPHDSYTVAELSVLVGSTPGDMVFVSDETGGATMAFYDGTDWRRIQDRQIIS
jgi:hypothetical protein